jgi:hypothetical protein
MKTSLDLRSKPRSLDGEDASTESLAQIAAFAIMQLTEGPALKLWALAQELAKAGSITIDKPDLLVLKEAIEKSSLINLAKAQLLNAIENALSKIAKDAKE